MKSHGGRFPTPRIYLPLWENGRLSIEVPNEMRDHLKQEMLEFTATHFHDVRSKIASIISPLIRHGFIQCHDRIAECRLSPP